MANDLVSYDVESGRSILDDDAEPVFTFTTTSATGTGIKAYASAGGTGADIDSTTGTGIDLDTTTGTGIDIDSTSGTGVDISTGGNALAALRSVGGSATIGLIKFTSSVASAAVMEFVTGLVSTASYAVYKGSLPVRMGNIDKVAYLHVYGIE